MKFIVFFLTLVFSAPKLFAFVVDQGGLWHASPSETGKLLFVAYEETELMRSRIGQWLPEGIFNLEGLAFNWKVDNIERVNNRISITVSIKFSNGKTFGYQYSHSDEGPDERLEAIVLQKNGEVHVSIKVGNGTERRILFGFGKDLADLQSKYTVSQAMPLWAWGSDKIVTIK
jgi:hypothetical protein